MPSTASGRFNRLDKHVGHLIAIHRKIQGGAGRRHRQEAIHRAGVVLTVAAWEAYVEEVVRETAIAMAPQFFQATVGERQTHSLMVAGVSARAKSFNTPDYKKVRNLFKLIKFDITGAWSWHAPNRNWNHAVMKKKLNEWLQIRHCVAHGADLPKSITWIIGLSGEARLTLNHLLECRRFFAKLVKQSDSAIRAHAIAVLGTQPW